jgi:hypothetical protein
VRPAARQSLAVGGHRDRLSDRSAQRRDHFAGEPFELLRVVDERVEEDELRPGVGDRPDAGGARLRRAGEDVLGPPAAAVVLCERVLEPLTPTRL